jgi:hypothetical protein
MSRARRLSALCLSAACIGATALLSGSPTTPAKAQSNPPNILFFIVDDLGIDQLGIFENSSPSVPATPNIDLLAGRGVKFTNVWAMPECSPSRAAFFTGRYPIRTGVQAAVMTAHLPQSYVSQFETTLPRVLSRAGYASAMVGKYHLGDEQDPARLCTPQTRGFAYFDGIMTAGPPSVDTTAGGVAAEGSQVCGYYQTTAAGACYTTPGDAVRCEPINAGNADVGTDPARTCLQRGGIFVPNRACGVRAPAFSDFSRQNGYYVWPRTILTGERDPYFVDTDESCGATTERTYLTKAQGNAGIAWWKEQRGPRMLTVSFNAMHTPVQKPPTDMVPDPQNNASTCSNALPPRNLMNMMIRGADVQIARVLGELGLATLNSTGRVITDLNLGNTMVVIIGDNGSQGTAVRPGSEGPVAARFNLIRAKTTVYQTGVWVPLIIAGAKVRAPGRTVDDMVNAVDLYKLFSDVAGVEVESLVPPAHTLDSRALLPYLNAPTTVPNGIRTTNYTEEGVATYSPDPAQRSYPCVLGNLCNDTLFPGKAFCEDDNGGTWYGPGGQTRLNSCCAVQASPGNGGITLAPTRQFAVRNRVFKLVEMTRLDCSAPITNASQTKAFPWAEYQATTSEEFYDIRKRPNTPNGLDNAPYNLAQNCAAGQDLTTCLPTQLDVDNYNRLSGELTRIRNSVKSQNRCQAKGDGNQDQRINQADLDGWAAFNGKGPSRYDINVDGVTDQKDRNIIQANLGLDCMDVCVRADLNRDGAVNNSDIRLLRAQRGACTDLAFCGGDLNGDGKVNAADMTIMTNAQQGCASSSSAAKGSNRRNAQRGAKTHM